MEQIFDEDVIIPLAGMACFFGTIVTLSLRSTLLEMYRVSRLSSLKERLLDSGLTVSEIERLVNAGLKSDGRAVDVTHAYHAAGHEVPMGKKVSP